LLDGTHRLTSKWTRAGICRIIPDEAIGQSSTVRPQGRNLHHTA
jgi:hypothetical protein